MHIGGEHPFPFGSVKTTIAHHGSGADNGAYMGSPCGVIFNIGGKKIYHTGDTALFWDMKLIGEISKPDIMLTPIGNNFTMGIEDAVRAVEFVRPQLTIPMHYNTFPVIKTDPNEFVSKIEQHGIKAKVMNYGETIEL